MVDGLPFILMPKESPRSRDLSAMRQRTPLIDFRVVLEPGDTGGEPQRESDHQAPETPRIVEKFRNLLRRRRNAQPEALPPAEDTRPASKRIHPSMVAPRPRRTSQAHRAPRNHRVR